MGGELSWADSSPSAARGSESYPRGLDKPETEPRTRAQAVRLLLSGLHPGTVGLFHLACFQALEEIEMISSGKSAPSLWYHLHA